MCSVPVLAYLNADFVIKKFDFQSVPFWDKQICEMILKLQSQRLVRVLTRVQTTVNSRSNWPLQTLLKALI